MIMDFNRSSVEIDCTRSILLYALSTVGQQHRQVVDGAYMFITVNGSSLQFNCSGSTLLNSWYPLLQQQFQFEYRADMDMVANRC